MVISILLFLIEISFTIVGAAFLARAWLHAIRFHPFNPFAQLIYRLTEWLCKPLRVMLPTSRSIDFASLVGVYLMAIAYLLLTWFTFYGSLLPSALWMPGLLAAAVTAARWAVTMVIWLTLIQAVLSWVNPLAPIMPILRTLSDPLLEPIRRILPKFSGFDFSPLVLLILGQITLLVLKSINFALVML